jgi:hypothetical protein
MCLFFEDSYNQGQECLSGHSNEERCFFMEQQYEMAKCVLSRFPDLSVKSVKFETALSLR